MLYTAHKNYRESFIRKEHCLRFTWDFMCGDDDMCLLQPMN